MPRGQTRNERIRLWVTYAVMALMMAAFLSVYALAAWVFRSSIGEPARWEAARRLPLWCKLAVYAIFLASSVWYESFPPSDAAVRWAAWALALVALATAVLSAALLQTGDPERDLLIVLLLIIVWRAVAALARRFRRRAAART